MSPWPVFVAVEPSVTVLYLLKVSDLEDKMKFYSEITHKAANRARCSSIDNRDPYIEEDAWPALIIERACITLQSAGICIEGV